MHRRTLPTCFIDPYAYVFKVYVLELAVRDVAKARGISTVADNAGLGRESLYKALKPSAKPCFDTMRRLLGALGVKFDVVAPHTQA